MTNEPGSDRPSMTSSGRTLSCQVVTPINGTEVSVACERERGHGSPHTGVYDDERYSWPHHTECMTQVGAPDLRNICDCRTLDMVSAPARLQS